jgi:hypothetical protein
MIAYHGDPEIKEKYLGRVRKHRALDQLIKGKYWAGGKGCAVGCTIHSTNHAKYETELGIPTAIAYLEDAFFENLQTGDALAWPDAFIEAIPVGADLSMVVSRFLHWLLLDEQDGLLRDVKADDVRAAVQAVGDCYARRILGDEPTFAQWAAAGELAWNARAAWAAWAAWNARAARAARAARDAWAARAAWDASVKATADKLLQLLREAPVPGAAFSPLLSEAGTATRSS